MQSLNHKKYWHKTYWHKKPWHGEFWRKEFWSDTYRGRPIAVMNRGGQWHVYLDHILQHNMVFATAELTSRIDQSSRRAARSSTRDSRQLSGFPTVNLDRHVQAQGYVPAAGAQRWGSTKRREFYDEYPAAMDLTGEFFRQTVDRFFVQHLMPRPHDLPHLPRPAHRSLRH
jgi:hypothetical protein